MIQAIGLTSHPYRKLPPAVEDVSFEAPAGQVTALLGGPRSGRTTVLRLLLGLQPGRGVAYFKGRPLHVLDHPAREVGALIGDAAGHPARSVRGHLRMLCAAVGVPTRRADEVLDVMGLAGLAEEPLGRLSRGMDRRLGLASALLGDPHSLVLDEPTADLSHREAHWMRGLLRAHAQQSGTVLFTTTDAKEAAEVADRVVVLERGRVVAEQTAEAFARTRLRPRVVVRSPYAARLADALTREARVARRSVEVVREEGNRLSVYGSSCADIGALAHRHGIPVHQLSDETGDMGPTTHSAPARAPVSAPAPGPALAPGAGPAASRVSLRPGGAVCVDGLRLAAEPAGGGAKDPGLPRAGESRGGLRPQGPEKSRAVPGSCGETAGEGRREGGVGEGGGAGPGVGADAEPEQSPPADNAPSGSAPSSKAPSGSARTSSAPTSNAPTGKAPTGSAPTRTALLNEPDPGARTPPRTDLRTADARAATASEYSQLPPPLTLRPTRAPVRALSYELRRASGVWTGHLTVAVVLFVSAVTSFCLMRSGQTPQERVIAAWPGELPLPPAALGAGVIGSLAFGEEFRYPALATERASVPRRLSLLGAKLTVTAGAAVLMALLVLACDAALLRLVYGSETSLLPDGGPSLVAGWLGLVVGCGWLGLLAAGVFRRTTAGLATLVGVSLVLIPLLERVARRPSAHSTAGFPARLQDLVLVRWPFGAEHHFTAVVRQALQPAGVALLLSISVLACAYVLISLRSRAQ